MAERNRPRGVATGAASDRPIDLVLHRIPNAKRSGNGWIVRCPAHEDRKPSLSIGVGDDGRVLLKCFAGCTAEAIAQSIELELHDLFPARLETPEIHRSSRVYSTACGAVDSLAKRHGPPSKSWTYTDAAGEPVGVVVRWDRCDGEKDIRPITRTGGGWTVKTMAKQRPLYRLPAIVDSDSVWVVEGELCVDAALSIGLCATTWAGGANAVDQTDWTPLAGKVVNILPDNDDAGRRAAKRIAETLHALGAVVRIIELPGLPESGDIVDWIAPDGAMGSRESTDIARALEELVGAAQSFTPDPLADDDASIGPVIVRLADVQTKPVDWLWYGRFAIGKVTLIEGDPGLGKSFLTIDLAARISRGCAWPDRRDEPIPVGGVVLMSAEDDVEDTIKPRLDAAGADSSRVYAVQAVEYRSDDGKATRRTFNLESDLPALANAIKRTPDCRLVVIDPISAYCGRTDSHRNTEVRGLLAPLAELAARYRVAIVAVTHLNKNASGSALYRAMGSLAFAAASRAVWLVAKDKDNPVRRLLLPVKNNLAHHGTGLAYSLAPSSIDGIARVAWEAEPVTTTADAALAADENDDRRASRESAKDWLRQALASGPIASKELLRQAEENGFRHRTLCRAQAELGIKPRKTGFEGEWVWELPIEGCQPGGEESQDCQQ